jgi:hypothetical protein
MRQSRGHAAGGLLRRYSNIEQSIDLRRADTTRLKGLLRGPLMRMRDVDTKIILPEAANDFDLRAHSSNNASIFAAQMKSL